MKVGVIGSGTMGVGLTQLFAQSDFIESTTWFLGNNSSFEDVFKKLSTRWSSAVNKGKISQNDYNRFTSKITAVDNYRSLRGLDFVIEAVTESMETKKEVLQRAAEYIEPNTIYATNTSSLSVTEISSVAKFKENVIGLHFLTLLQL